MPSAPNEPQPLPHWLAQRLQRCLAVLATTPPHFLTRLRRLAREQALQSLGLQEVAAEWQAIAALRRDLDQLARQAHRALLALVRRVPLEQIPNRPGRRLHPEVRRAVRQRQRLHEEELLSADERGRQLLRWRRERQELPQTLALALASRPLQNLWRNLLALLGEEPTPLQQAVLAQPANPETPAAPQAEGSQV